jgi:AcrR family transcriptional regulator
MGTTPDKHPAGLSEIGPVNDANESPVSGRTVRLPRSARRRQLLTAAQEVFVANGYHAAAMDDIAERAGVSKPVLYQHFPSKLELYLALLDTHSAALIARVREAMDGTTENKIRVQAAIDAYYEFVDGEGEAFRLVFESDLRNEPAVGERVEEVNRSCMAAIADAITADTGLSRQQAELLAMGLIGAAEVSARYWLATDRAVSKPEAVELLASLNWRGISGFPRQV